MTTQAVPAPAVKRSRLVAELRKNLWIYLVLVPPFALLTLFTLVPVIQSFLLSFQNWSLRNQTFAGLDNYTHLVNDPVFWQALQNTTVYTLVVVPGGLIIALVLAEFIRPQVGPVQTFFK